QAAADVQGNFVIPSLPVGSYTVRAELANFNTEVREAIVLEVAQRRQLDFELQIGQITTQVTVVESAPLLDTADAAVTDVITNDRILRLPLNGRRYADLLLVSDNLT